MLYAPRSMAADTAGLFAAHRRDLQDLPPLELPMTLAAGALSYEQVTVFLLAFAVLLGTARVFGEVARKLGQPVVLGEILAGVVLGATVLGSPSLAGPDGWNVQLYDWLFPVYAEAVEAGPPAVDLAAAAGAEASAAEASAQASAEPAPRAYDGGFLSMSMFLQLSAVFLLLVAGLEVDLSIVWRQGRATLWISLMSMVVPFALGFGLAYLVPGLLGYDTDSGKLIPFALFLGVAMSITALPVIAKILMDLNLFRSDVGMLIMASAMVNDLLGWIGFAMVLALVAVPVAGIDPGVDSSLLATYGPVLRTIGLTLLFVGGMLTAGRWLIHRVLPFIQAHSAWPGGVLSFVLCVALVCAAITEAIGIHSIFGAFIAGVAIGDSAHLRRQTRQHVEQFIGNVFAPLFFASIGLRVNFVEGFDLTAVTLVLVIAILGKIVGCWIGARIAGMSHRDATAIGMGMSARGAMEIILGQLALSQGLITEKLFVAIVVMAIVTSLIAGPAMQAVLRRKTRKRLADLVSDKLFAEDLAGRTPEAAIAELAGRAAPVAGLDARAIADAAMFREGMIPTGLPGGVAVPHARLEGVSKPLVVVGRSQDGVDFDAADGSRARIVCLLISPASDPDAQLDLLRAVGEAFERRETREAALAATGYTEFKAALMTVESEGH